MTQVRAADGVALAALVGLAPEERDRLVEVGLFEPGLYRDRRRLEDFRRVRPDHVDADDLLRRIVDHQLVKRPLVAAGKDVLHRPEIAGVGFHLAQLVARLPLRHPDAGDRGCEKTAWGTQS